MEVLSEIERRTSPRRAPRVQEFLLLNHPVDCPICDQAGECKLQDYWLEHQGTQQAHARRAGAQAQGRRFGPTIVYDAERCIMCTRCIRFCDEVAKDPRARHARARQPERDRRLARAASSTTTYTLMTEHVCPVGALTAKRLPLQGARLVPARAQQRVRGLRHGLQRATSTSIRATTRSTATARATTRQVNKYWMCDDGMLDYRRVHEDRVLDARVGGEDARRIERGARRGRGAARGRADAGRVAVVSQRAALERGQLRAARRSAATARRRRTSSSRGRPPGEGRRHPASAPTRTRTRAGVMRLLRSRRRRSRSRELRRRASSAGKSRTCSRSAPTSRSTASSRRRSRQAEELRGARHPRRAARRRRARRAARLELGRSRRHVRERQGHRAGERARHHARGRVAPGLEARRRAVGARSATPWPGKQARASCAPRSAAARPAAARRGVRCSQEQRDELAST